MTDDFDDCVDFLLDIEGGLVDDKKDEGGITNFGISMMFLQQEGVDINLDGYVNKKDIIFMTREQAKNIYKKYWWDKWGYYRINSKLVRAKILEMSVHFGSGAAHKMLQQAVNVLEDAPLLTVDGVLGYFTLSAANRWGDFLKTALKVQAMAAYSQRIRATPSKERFRNGWMRRADS